ncbi:eCIS core domain-containing protein [Actinomycetospora flava]|uniref:DUF4157 domain-containing protein n=1 Tax=Actinomycetospora flava TaxID=3129232 RepID=A0ABU8M5G6_9PSEU
MLSSNTLTGVSGNRVRGNTRRHAATHSARARELAGKLRTFGRFVVTGAGPVPAEPTRTSGRSADSPWVRDTARPTAAPVVREGGRPLDDGVRREMGRLLGHDFSEVRVHAGPDARRSAAAIGAGGYTRGEDVVLGTPTDTRAGRWLLAHELAHVAQQDVPARGRAAAAPGPSSVAAEGEADRAATAVVGGQTFHVSEHLDRDALALGPTPDDSGIVEYPGPPGPPIRPRPGRLPSNTSSTAARAEFDRLQPEYARRLGVAPGGQVHHGIELQVLDRYPGAFTAAELNSLTNVRGIRPELENRRQLHNSRIRDLWDRFYTQLDAEIARSRLVPGTSEWVAYVREFLLECRTQIDYFEGIFFAESSSVRLTEEDQKRADAARKALGFDPLAPPGPSTYFETRLHRGLPVAVGQSSVPASAFRLVRHPATKEISHWVAQVGATLVVVTRHGEVVGTWPMHDAALQTPLIDPIDVFVAIITAGSGLAVARGGAAALAEAAGETGAREATQALAETAPRIRVAGPSGHVRVAVHNGVRIAADEVALDTGEVLAEEVQKKVLRMSR